MDDIILLVACSLADRTTGTVAPIASARSMIADSTVDVPSWMPPASPFVSSSPISANTVDGDAMPSASFAVRIMPRAMFVTACASALLNCPMPWISPNSNCLPSSSAFAPISDGVPENTSTSALMAFDANSIASTITARATVNAAPTTSRNVSEF